MRDLLFRNLTSNDRKRRVIASSEISDKGGVRSIINRHFICMIREVEKGTERPEPSLHVLKEHNSREQREKFFCKIKGSVYAVNQGKVFLITFMHSLRINLISTPQNVA